jgi:hypothetical protein
MGLEDIVSKRLSAPYRSGPSRDWIKVKNPDSPAMIRAGEGKCGLCASSPKEPGPNLVAQGLRRFGRRRRALHLRRLRRLRGLRLLCPAGCECRQLLGRQVPRLGVDRFGRRAIKGDAVIAPKDGSAVDRAHLPTDEHAARVRHRPSHGRSDLVGGADRQRADIVRFGRERERPLLLQQRELRRRVLDAAIKFGCHVAGLA